MKTLVLLLSLMTTCLQAQAIKPEEVIPDFGEYEVVNMGICQPKGHMATRMCIVSRKGDNEVMSIHDYFTKQVVEIRSDKKILWQLGWWRT